MGIWLHTHIITTRVASPDLWELAEILPDASVRTLQEHFACAVEPFKLQPISMSYIYERFEHPLRLWMGIWLYIHTITTTDTSPDLWEMAEIQPDASVQTMPLHLGWGCRDFQTASHVMPYIYERFEHFIKVWIGIWLHIHTITTTDTSLKLWKLAEILPDACVQTMPVRLGWGCRTIQTASHVHAIHIWEVWSACQIVDGHMALYSHHYHHRHFPKVLKVGWNPACCNCAYYTTVLWLRL